MARLLTMQEVSDWLQIPVATLRIWRHRGEGPPALKLGKHVRFDESDVRHWLDGRRAGTGRGPAPDRSMASREPTRHGTRP